MGKIKHQGLATGTSGTGQISLENTFGPNMNSALKKLENIEIKNKKRKDFLILKILDTQIKSIKIICLILIIQLEDLKLNF